MHPSASQLASNLRITAVESDRACGPIHQALLEGLASSLPPTELRTVITSLPRLPALLRRERFEFIVVGLCLNELEIQTEGAADWISGLVSMLSDDGVLIIIEPALRETTRRLQEVRDELATRDGAKIIAPCLHARACPMLTNPRDWCHAELAQDLPLPLQGIAKEAGLRDHRLTFSYLCVGPNNPAPDSSHEEFRLVSSLLGSKGKVEAVACGQSGYFRLMRLDRHCSKTNTALDDLNRGQRFRTSASPDDKGRLRILSEDHVTPCYPIAD